MPRMERLDRSAFPEHCLFIDFAKIFSVTSLTRNAVDVRFTIALVAVLGKFVKLYALMLLAQLLVISSRVCTELYKSGLLCSFGPDVRNIESFVIYRQDTFRKHTFTC